MENNTYLKNTSNSLSNSNKRQSNFELLRIIAMLMIIGHHFAVHTGFTFSENIITPERAYLQLISMGGKLGIDLFILISGYFLIKSTKLKVSKILKLWLSLLFYAVIIYLYFLFTHKVPGFDREYFLNCIFPVAFSQWGFMSKYFVMFLLSPFINAALNNLDKKTYRNLLILFFILWSVVPTLFNLRTGFHVNYEASDLIWFIYVYAIASFIRLYHNDLSHKASFYFLLFLIFAFASFLLFILFDHFGYQTESFGSQVSDYFTPQYLTIFPSAVSLFLFFKSLNIKYSKFINILASATFGVYLIHDNFLTRSILWSQIFHGLDYVNTIKIIPYSLFAIGLIFVVCSIIELFRLYLIEKPYMKLIVRLDKNI